MYSSPILLSIEAALKTSAMGLFKSDLPSAEPGGAAPRARLFEAAPNRHNTRQTTRWFQAETGRFLLTGYIMSRQIIAAAPARIKMCFLD